MDALVDLPFALPTAVAGIALTALYAGNGWIGQFFEPLGIKIAFTPLGIFVALTFIGLPFVVRTVQPVLEDIESELEEAAATLGATRLQTFLRVIFPTVLPALMTGFALAFARAIGEYGSVIFIAGNMPMVSEITPLLIITKLEQYDYAGRRRWPWSCWSYLSRCSWSSICCSGGAGVGARHEDAVMSMSAIAVSAPVTGARGPKPNPLG